MERLHQFEAARMRNQELKEKSERILELELQVSSMKAQEEYSKNLIAIRNKEMELKIQHLTLLRYMPKKLSYGCSELRS